MAANEMAVAAPIRATGTKYVARGAVSLTVGDDMFRSLIFMGLCLSVSGCTRTPPDYEQQVRQALVELEEAVESRSISRVKEGVAASYHDHWGNNKSAVIRQLQLQFLKGGAVHALTTIRRLEVAPNKRSADVLIYVAVGSTPISGLKAIDQFGTDLLRMELHLIRDDDEWLIERTNWRRARVSELAEEIYDDDDAEQDDE